MVLYFCQTDQYEISDCIWDYDDKLEKSLFLFDTLDVFFSQIKHIWGGKMAQCVALSLKFFPKSTAKESCNFNIYERFFWTINFNNSSFSFFFWYKSSEIRCFWINLLIATNNSKFFVQNKNAIVLDFLSPFSKLCQIILYQLLSVLFCFVFDK